MAVEILTGDICTHFSLETLAALWPACTATMGLRRQVTVARTSTGERHRFVVKFRGRALFYMNTRTGTSTCAITTCVIIIDGKTVPASSDNYLKYIMVTEQNTIVSVRPRDMAPVQRAQKIFGYKSVYYRQSRVSGLPREFNIIDDPREQTLQCLYLKDQQFIESDTLQPRMYNTRGLPLPGGTVYMLTKVEFM